ncbi:type IV pilus biogenesis protein PilM [Cytobacillus purgationiresistens]|uniref:Type IV pilus assembly protein PilM n=1 Tax=Cytobacillus purgationiresistens TaxID=863449 RepID=A0ABU0AFE5_9BACI|nr:pilus assembly protein PilM [Cytobacillus purgationiresistens]MDQ0269987.1 type IV pilus assembly protein PilM [Cytobacillus purgationiresistens]
MALPLISTRNRICNIIINDYSIRYVELKQKNAITRVRWHERMIPNDIVRDGKIIDLHSMQNILDSCVDEWMLRRKAMRFIVPDPFVIIRKITIPGEISKDEIKGYLYMELGSSIHLPFEEPVFDYSILSEDDDKKELLLFAAQEEPVLQYERLYSSARLAPKAADISPLALYRLYHYLDMHKKGESLMMIQLDLTTVNISILENGIPLFMHHINLGLNEEIGRGVEQSHLYDGKINEYSLPVEDIYREMARLMDFYRYSIKQNSQQVTNILINGDHPQLELFEQEMKARFEFPVQKLQLEAAVDEAGNLLPRSMYLALGLALKEVH